MRYSYQLDNKCSVCYSDMARTPLLDTKKIRDPEEVVMWCNNSKCKEHNIKYHLPRTRLRKV